VAGFFIADFSDFLYRKWKQWKETAVAESSTYKFEESQDEEDERKSLLRS
jgi:hypothetical protein